jgi:eukaryotic-like serine/threonine-protein kinase
LLREAEYLKSLESPYILHVENADIFQDLGYLATEVAAGGSAEDHLGIALPPDRVVSLVRQALIGLRACHDHRLVHCDVKPANVFLHDRERATLGDFGAAQRMDEHGLVRAAGDPLIRAPEMLKGAPGSPRTDVYSVGVTLYRLLTGRWPVDWVTDFAALRVDVVAGRYPALNELAPHVPRTLRGVVRNAMAVSPAARYQTAEAVSIALGRVDLGRRWAHREPHDGHTMCWTDAPSGQPKREVCVISDARTSSITTRRATGARTRIAALCLPEIPTQRLPLELRRIFGTV